MVSVRAANLAATAVVLALAASTSALVARADKWGPPERLEVVSANAAYAFIAEPNSLGDPGTATGELRRADGSLVWQKPLLNDAAPVSAIVSDDGLHVATFDNWHYKGHGADTVVIYDARGEVLHHFALGDFLSLSERVRLVRSISSIHWGGTHLIVDGKLFLSIQIMPWEIYEAPGSAAATAWKISPDRFVERRIDLVTGRVLDEPAAHPVDAGPPNECPDGLVPGSRWVASWSRDLATFCLDVSGEPTREGPAAFWRPTRAGWRVVERGQYRKRLRSGAWQRWSDPDGEPCEIDYVDGQIERSSCP